MYKRQRNSLPVISWQQRLDDKTQAAFAETAKARGQDINQIREPLSAELNFYFVPGAPAYLTRPINQSMGIVNSTFVRLHSLTLAAGNDDEWQRIYEAGAGEIVMLREPPLSVNVEVCRVVLMLYLTS